MSKFLSMSMDRAELDDILDYLRLVHGDTADIEVKRAAGGLPERIGESVCAFANTPEGGVIIFGVDEANDLSIAGVADPATVRDGLVGVTRDAVTPSPHIDSAVLDVDGVAVVVAKIRPVLLSQRPALFENRAYFRQGDGDHVMSEDDLRYLEAQKIIEATTVDHDLLPVPTATTDDFDADLRDALLRSLKNGTPRLRGMSDGAVLRRVGVVDAHGTPTVAGLYAIGEFPQGPCPQLTVTAAVRLPADQGPARTQNLQRFEGPLPDLLVSVTAWIEQNLATRQTYTVDGSMRDLPEFPGRAVREAVANALVHRDLSPHTASRGIDIRIDGRSLLIMNPGRLSAFSWEQLSAGHLTRSEVNRHLYRLATHLRTAHGDRVIEGEGGGILEIFRSLRERGLKRPQIFDSGVTVTAKLWRGPMFDAAQERWLATASGGRELSAVQKWLLLEAEDGAVWDLARVRREFSPLSADEARGAIGALSRWGLIAVDEDTAALSYTGRRVSEREASRPPSVAARTDHRPPHPNQARIVIHMDTNGPQSVAGLVAATGLSDNQVRYALARLMDMGRVRREGGQGIRGTLYHLVEDS